MLRDPVTRVMLFSDSSNVEKRCCEDSTRVTFLTEQLNSTRVASESSFRVIESRVRVIFTKYPNIILANTASLYTRNREMSFYVSSDALKYWCKLPCITRLIYMVVLASAVEGSFDAKRAQRNWTKTRTLQLCVYMHFRTTGLGVLWCWLQASGASFTSKLILFVVVEL